MIGSLQSAPATNHLNKYEPDVILKNAKMKQLNITLIGKAFHILPAVHAKECSIMFVHGADKTSLRPLALVLFVLIHKLICS